MKAPMIASPLGLLDCCPTTDGAAAAIITVLGFPDGGLDPLLAGGGDVRGADVAVQGRVAGPAEPLQPRQHAQELHGVVQGVGQAGHLFRAERLDAAGAGGLQQGGCRHHVDRQDHVKGEWAGATTSTTSSTTPGSSSMSMRTLELVARTTPVRRACLKPGIWTEMV